MGPRMRALLPVALLSACATSTPNGAGNGTASGSQTAQSVQPLWSSPKALKQTCEEGLSKVKDKREAVKSASARTLEGTLVPYNEMLIEVDQVLGMIDLIANVAPEKPVREAAEACERDFQALLSDINLDRSLYEAISAVPTGDLDPQAQRFVKKLLREFKRSGVDKDEATRKKLKELQAEMTKIGQAFSRVVREDVKTIKVDPKRLKGLPEDFIKAHAAGEDGKISLTTNYPDFFPVQRYAEDETLRKQLYEAFLTRGYPANDTNLKKLLQLRQAYAKLLGYTNWADYNAEDKMAGSAKTIDEFISKITKIARPRMEADLVDLLARKKKDSPKARAIQTWDRFYYVGKVQAEKHGFDARKVRPYFEYKAVTKGLMDLYGELFGISFKPNTTAPKWHDSVTAWDLFFGEERIGMFYLDMHPRDGKYGHAAMFPIITGLQDGQIPVASLVCNFPDPAKTSPALMEHSQVKTYFHEFGHLIHHLLARGSKWTNLSGINVEWDFVEAPSQLLEEWAWDPAVLQRFAKHTETGEPIPADMVNKMRASSEFGKGLHIMRQIYYTALSFYLHTADPQNIELLDFAKDIQKKYSPFPYPEGTHGYSSFGHLVGYSSMYYTYQWSLTLAKDIFTRFEAAGLLDANVAKAYREEILMPGGTKDAAELVKSFLGRPHNLQAYERWLQAE